MEKAASKVRQETKIIVSTETESTFESEMSAEIKNENDEKAITYEYHELQQQYEVYTSLAEVEGVIFVAEKVPSLNSDYETESWISRYDWIIAKVLKDESFRGALNDLINNPTREKSPSDHNMYRDIAEAASKSFATFATKSDQTSNGTYLHSGLNIPDIFSNAIRSYQAENRHLENRSQEEKVKEIARKRLYSHTRDNILYYCRAVWSSEDPDQRLLRYKKDNRRIPLSWSLPLEDGEIIPSAISFSAIPEGVDAPVWEVIDSSGPVGYMGNYAVFSAKATPETEITSEEDKSIVSLNGLSAALRHPYLDPDPEKPDTLLDPALNYFKGIASAKDKLDDETVIDLVSHLPRRRGKLLIIKADEGKITVDRNNDLTLKNPVSKNEWAEYLYRKNNTRRFLVNSNNLYLSIRTDDGSTFEPFKRAHRIIDVENALQDLKAARLKNLRRENLIGDGKAFDPDITKVVVVDKGEESISNSVAGLEAEISSIRTENSYETDEPPRRKRRGIGEGELILYHSVN